jgi:hypothetical protein
MVPPNKLLKMASVVSVGIKAEVTAKCTVCTVRYSMLFRSIQEMEDYGLGRGLISQVLLRDQLIYAGARCYIAGV